MISLLGRREALRELQDAVDRYLDVGNNVARNQLDRLNAQIRTMETETYIHDCADVVERLASVHE